MKSLSREAAFEQWEVFWNDTHEAFFKLEALQDYGAEENLQSPSYRAWINGDKEISLNLIKANANNWAKQTKEKPIQKIRIHLVRKPYSEYLKWEIEHYKLSNIPLGDEKVYLVDYSNIPGLTIPGDFMIFDNNRVANSHYNQKGLLLGMDFYDEGENINLFLKIRDELLKHAKLLKSY